MSYLFFFSALGFPPGLPVPGNVSLQQGCLEKLFHDRKVAEMLLRGTKKHLDFGVLC